MITFREERTSLIKEKANESKRKADELLEERICLTEADMRELLSYISVLEERIALSRVTIERINRK